ncbi:MAG: hypothetical protein QNI86_07955 [Halieaceae bacterium]|nr:hypothetical protein [Halieaceae bacterium]
MARPVDLACFSAHYLALLRRFPNQMQPNSALVMAAPDAPGVLVFAASHNHHYLMFHDPGGFSQGVYEFGLPIEFFEAVGPRHMDTLGKGDSLRLALSNGEYRLYQGTENNFIFDASADSDIVFTWSGRITRAHDQLRDAFDAILYLHQSGNTVPVKQALSATYFSEVNFIRTQLTRGGSVLVGHRWVRLPDDSVRCLSQFTTGKDDDARVEAVLCVDADMALG